MRHKISKLVFTLVLFSASSSPLLAEDTVPVPPKRPDIMKVSPAYIEKLRQRALDKDTKPSTSQNIHQEHEPKQNAPVPSSPVQKKRDVNDKTQLASEGALIDENEQTQELRDLRSQDVLQALNGVVPQKPIRKSSQDIENVPTPKRKPVTLSSLQHITPAAGTGHAGDDDSTLISFAMQSGQVHLTESLHDFLKNHVVALMDKDPALQMSIHAYATPIDEQPYSDVRLSLARALEVRSFLINNNIDPARLNLSPMGRDKTNSSDDRIDLVFTSKD